MMMQGKVIELVFRRRLGAPKTKRGKTAHVLDMNSMVWKLGCMSSLWAEHTLWLLLLHDIHNKYTYTKWNKKTCIKSIISF